MSEMINVKLLSDDALNYMYKNVDTVTKKIQSEKDNNWIYNTFPQPMFVEKKYKIEDFNLCSNPNSTDKEKDYNNSIVLYNSLKKLPRYLLIDERFWLWLHLDKFYEVVKEMMTIKSSSTVKDHWMHRQGKRRSLFFGVLSRMYFRVELTEENGDYTLTKWIVDNPNRFRNLTWRTYSSEKHVILGILKGEKKAFDELNVDRTDVYEQISKYVSNLGSVMLLDSIESETFEELIYQKIKELSFDDDAISERN